MAGLLEAIFGGGQAKAEAWDWSPYLQGGGKRDDAISGMSPDFRASLQQLYEAAPENIRPDLGITSAYRTPAHQAQIISDHFEKYGFNGEARARWDADVASMGPVGAGAKWAPEFGASGMRSNIALPGSSQHQKGSAMDFKFGSDAAREWAHENAANYGMRFPMKHEPWHIEPTGARGVVPNQAAPHQEEAAPTVSPEQGLMDWAMQQQSAQEDAAMQPSILSPVRQMSAYQPNKRDYAAPYRNFMKTLR